MKKAVLTLDVEDWYHLDYFDRHECDTNNSLLDGLDVYVELLESLSLPSSFFVLGEIAETKIGFFKDLVKSGHDVGSHGWNHIRPMTLGIDEFRADLQRSRDVMKEINGERGFGYRAPCFSLDRERLDIVRDSGFVYDSSRIDFGNHPLYGSIDMHGYDKLSEAVYRSGDFMEFEATTLSVLGKNIPISGGGYLRLFPWLLMKTLVSQYLKKNDLYVLYIHPFELSQLQVPAVPKSTSTLTKFRYSHGRNRVVDKITRLVYLLRSNGYSFTTFSEIQKELAR
ncbi:polysaccharide deacetylase family protein [Porticoccaceae bacterium]|nr:polysaccharide deacetylase family protein [Porticoccaceae bacterium]